MTAPAPHGYVWSRWTARPVEHISDGEFSQPLCGAPLAPERLHISDRPSGLAPLCERCQRKALRRTT